MRIMYNASRKVEQYAAIRKATLANAEALAKDEKWQATLAAINAKYPNGVMHK